MVTDFVGLNDELADIFTKSLKGALIESVCHKLSAYDIYSVARGGVSELVTF